MSEVIFCATDFYLKGGYRSYTDYFRLAELAGYPIIPLSELDPQSDNTYIVTPLNDEWLQGWQKPKARIIHWELEWRWDWRADVDTPPGVSEVWASDKWFAESIGARYVPMGSDDRLCEALYFRTASPAGWFYDTTQIAYQTPRRAKVTEQLKGFGLRIAPCENQWGIDRSVNLIKSGVMVHVHQNDNQPGIAPLRWCLAAAHKLPIISETVNDRGIFGYTHMVTSGYNTLAEFTAHMLKHSPLELENYALALHNLLCERLTFRKSVEAAV